MRSSEKRYEKLFSSCAERFKRLLLQPGLLGGDPAFDVNTAYIIEAQKSESK